MAHLYGPAGRALNTPQRRLPARAVDQIEPPFNYTSDVASLVPTYLRLIPEYKVLIYNGDVDPWTV